jgi:hypothetical protein
MITFREKGDGYSDICLAHNSIQQKISFSRLVPQNLLESEHVNFFSRH